MTARQTVPRLEAFAYAVRSLWGFQVIYGETGHGNLEMDRSHDTYLMSLKCQPLLRFLFQYWHMILTWLGGSITR